MAEYPPFLLLEMAEQVHNTSHLEVPYGPEQKPWKDSLSPFARSSKGDLYVSPPSNDPKVIEDHNSKVTACWYISSTFY